MSRVLRSSRFWDRVPAHSSNLIGSSEGFDFMVLGAAANEASRIQACAGRSNRMS